MPDTLKILQVCNKFPYPPHDGGAIAKYNMIKGFFAAGQSLTVAAINTSKHYFDPAQMPEKVKKMARFETVFVNTSLKPLYALKNLLFSSLPYNAERFINKDFEILLEKLLKENNYDVVQLEGLYLCPYVPLIRKHSQALIAYRAHNVEHEIWDRLAKGMQNPLKRWYTGLLADRIKKMEINNINQYDVLVPITERDNLYFKKAGNTKPALVTPTGLNIEAYEKYEKKPEEVECSLFHIGGLDWQPNVISLLWFFKNVWKEIQKEFPRIKFYLAGRNASKRFLQQIAEYENIVYLGEVDDSRQFMASHAIMVVPLLSGSGMRIKIIEGMASGKTIISTSIGAEGIPYENEKSLFIANQPEEFIDYLRKIISNPQILRTTSMEAKKIIRKHFDNTLISASLAEFYAQQIKQKA